MSFFKNGGDSFSRKRLSWRYSALYFLRWGTTVRRFRFRICYEVLRIGEFEFRGGFSRVCEKI